MHNVTLASVISTDGASGSNIVAAVGCILRTRIGSREPGMAVPAGKECTVALGGLWAIARKVRDHARTTRTKCRRSTQVEDGVARVRAVGRRNGGGGGRRSDGRSGGS